ncbi:MAG TPA: hypothetical protein DCY35_03895 [Prolixibacteraceae bacterium]|nr:hypothetical protein [Prolixibacteraceae bacterium]
MKQKIPFIFQLMYVIFWIVFIGLSIKAGVLVISFIISLAVSAQAASDLYLGLDLTELFNFERYHYIGLMVLAIILAMLKASIAMKALQVASGFNIDKPFNMVTTHMIIGDQPAGPLHRHIGHYRTGIYQMALNEKHQRAVGFGRSGDPVFCRCNLYACQSI